jgi:hypothetical protein
MKKAFGYLGILGACALAVLATLFILEIITLTLWVKYLFLLSCLAVILSLYLRYGKRTIFEDCLYCLRMARKKLRRIQFDKKERTVGLSLLTVRNYLAFAEKYIEDIYIRYDLHKLKQHIERLKTITAGLTKSHQNEVQRNKDEYLLFLESLYEILDEETQRILAEKKALKEAGKRQSKGKKS